MNKYSKLIYKLLSICLLLGGAFFFSGCLEKKHLPKDVSTKPEYLKGLKVNADYTLQSDVFYRVYEDKPSLHGPKSVWCDFSINEFQSGSVTNQYTKGIVRQGTRIQFKRAIVNDLETHTVILYYAVIQNGDYQGKEVLINSLVDDLAAWLKETPHL